MIGFGFYQSCWNRGSVGRVFGLRWCWGQGCGSGGVMSMCCESGFFVEMAGPGICVLCSADTCAS